jgi:PTH2 family peptidyl-tRNA hydrolase
MSKQVIVMRKDLRMTKGKMISQGGHASLGVILEMMRNGQSHENFTPKIVDGKYIMPLEVEAGSQLDLWIRGMFTKICVYVESEEALLDIYDKAKSKGLPVVLIEDNGLTMFNGVKTKTCLAIGPAGNADIDEITGHLRLL